MAQSSSLCLFCKLLPARLERSHRWLVVVCPLCCSPPPPPLPMPDATSLLLSLCPSLSSPDNNDSGSSARGWQGFLSSQCAQRQHTLAESPAPRQLLSPLAALDAPLAPCDIMGGRRRQRPLSVSVDFGIVVFKRRGGVRVMAVPETGADSDQQCQRSPTTTKGSWEGSAVFLLGVTASFLIKDRIGYNRVKNSIIVHEILHDLA